jgi:Icc-related predicted phosphoesterase
MTLLHVSDLHFRQPWFHWLRDHAPAHDALIISGDLLDHRLPDVPAQMAWVSAWLRASPVPVVVSSGNHDLEWDAARYRWQPAYWLRDLPPPVYPDGAVLECDGLSLAPIACTQRPRSAAAEAWVVHTPPADTGPARTVAGFDRGDRLLAEAMRRQAPSYVFCGHVHEPERWHETTGPTVVFNPGSNPTGAGRTISCWIWPPARRGGFPTGCTARIASG